MTTDEPLLTGIDLGTSSFRAIAFTTTGRQVAASVRPTPMTAMDVSRSIWFQKLEM